MSTSPDRVKQIIADQELDCLVAYSADGTRKLDMVAGNVSDLQTAVDLMECSLPGPYKLEGYREKAGTARGRKTDQGKPFVWIMRGVQDRPAQPAAAPVATVREVAVPDKEALKQAAEARADARIAEMRATILEEELARLREDADVEYEEEDEEEDEEEENMVGPRPFWEDEEKLMRVADHVTGSLAKLLGRGAPEVPKTAGITDEERELLSMARKWKEVQPEQYSGMVDQLKNAFGNGSEAGQQ